MDKNQHNKIRIAAVGDIHFRESNKGKFKDDLKKVSEEADVLLLCGDLTDNGLVSEAEALREELNSCGVPIVAVLGNHDYDKGHQEEIKKVLTKDKMFVLDGDSIVIKDVGFAGIKGFGGGFDKYMLSTLGESIIKDFVQEAVNESLKLDHALTLLDKDYLDIKKVVVLHYAPVKATVIGEPEDIFPFLGSSRLVEPINRRQVDAVFHGHAHVGTIEGSTTSGIKVFNVAKPLLIRSGYGKPFYLYEV